jgi:hypothetical protein
MNNIYRREIITVLPWLLSSRLCYGLPNGTRILDVLPLGFLQPTCEWTPVPWNLEWTQVDAISIVVSPDIYISSTISTRLGMG